MRRIGPSAIRPTLTRLGLVAAALLPVVASCGGDSGGGSPTDPPEPGPARVEALDGVDAAEVGATVAARVRVTDSEGGASAGVEVGWQVRSGGGTVSSATTTTASDGVAEVAWTLGPEEGQQTLRATVEGAGSATITVEATPPAAVCPDLSFARTEATPVDTVRFTGLPAGFDAPLAGRVIAGTDTAFTYAEGQEGGAGFLLSPIHPAGEVDGGEVRIELTDGSASCEAVDFRVEELAPAPGTFASTVDSLQALVRVQADMLGVTLADLHTDRPDTLPEPLWPLFVAESVLGNPDNPNNLERVVAGTAPVVSEIGWDPALADALLARADVVAALGVQLGHARGGGGAGSAGAAPERASPGTAGPLRVSVGECWSPSSAADLDQCMAWGAQAGQAQSGVVNQALQQWSADVLVWVGLVPQLSAAVTIVGGAIWLADKVMSGAARLLPSHFVGMDYTPTMTEFAEDSEETGEWKDAWVQARTRGWVLDQTILEGIMQVLGATGQYDDYINGFMKNGSLRDDVNDFVMTEGTNHLISEAGNAGIIAIDPVTTPKVDITADTWSNRFVLAEQAIKMLDHHRYEPDRVGVATLRVESEPSRFGDAHRETDKEIEVKAIDVRVDPDYVVVNPGDEVDFTVTVENSVHPELLEVEVDHGTATVSYNGGNSHTVTVKTPADGERYPILLTARSTSQTGARAAADAPPRVGTATLSTDVGVVVEPGGVCLTFGETQQFSATVSGAEDQRVTWEAGGGSITEGGLFTAPDAPGQVEVTATSVVDPDRRGSATVVVAESCTCWWTATVSGGGFSASFAGDSIGYVREILPDGSLGDFQYTIFGSGTPGQAGFSYHDVHAVPPLDVASDVTGHPARIGGTADLVGGVNISWGGDFGEGESNGSLDLLDNGLPRLVRGRAYGSIPGDVTLPGESSQDAVYSVDIRFQADLAPGLLEITGQDPGSFCAAR